MARKTRHQPARDDQPFQLPAADLVFDPQEVLARVKTDIEKFIALDEELGERALHLAEDLNTLTRYKIAEPETVRKICQIILKMPLFLNVQNPLRTPVVRNDDEEDGSRDIDPSSSSSPQCKDVQIVQSLCDHLRKLGITTPEHLIYQYGFDRVAEALEYVLDQPEGRIKDLPGYIITTVVGRPGKVSPGKTADRFLKGRYGHLVRH